MPLLLSTVFFLRLISILNIVSSLLVVWGEAELKKMRTAARTVNGKAYISCVVPVEEPDDHGLKPQLMIRLRFD